MDSVSENPRGGHLLTELLKIHLIIPEVGKFLTLRELMSCSEVSTSWCTIFRNYIHSFRKCSIALRWADRPCTQLKILDDLLNQSGFPLAFNGMFIREWEREWVIGSCSADNHDTFVEESYDTLLSKVYFTSFVIFWPSYKHPDEIICPALRCMKKIMTLNAGELKTLTLLESPLFRRDSLLDYYQVEDKVRPRWLAKLQTFIKENTGLYSMKHIQEILESSPNLKVIKGNFSREMFEETVSTLPSAGIIPTNKYRCITGAYGLSASQLLRLANQAPRLKHLSLFCHFNRYTFEQNDESSRCIAAKALNSLFRSSWSSLGTITCDIFHLCVMSREVSKASWPVPNVSTINLYSTWNELSYLKYMNLTQMFPKLAHIFLSTDRYYCGLYPTFLTCELGFEYADSSLTHLHAMNYIPEEHLKDLESVFPNVEHFLFHNCELIPEMCAALWQMNWDRLTTIQFCSLQINFDVDSVIFGLTREERKNIDREALGIKEYHHIYSKYSAFNLKGLKKIQLDLEECQAFVPAEEVYDRRQVFPLVSRITAHNIYNQFPGLDMEVTVECANLEDPGEPICEDARYRTLHQPDIEETTCLHKRSHPHRSGHHFVKKYKFNVCFK